MPLAQPADHYGRNIPMVAPAFFRMADVIRITALSRATLYRRVAEGKFPPPVHLGGRHAAGRRQRYKPGSMIRQAIRSPLRHPNTRPTEIGLPPRRPASYCNLHTIAM